MGKGGLFVASLEECLTGLTGSFTCTALINPRIFQVCFEANPHFLNDNVTEKLRLFKCSTREEMKAVVNCFSDKFLTDHGKGSLCALYSMVLSRTPEK